MAILPTGIAKGTGACGVGYRFSEADLRVAFKRSKPPADPTLVRERRVKERNAIDVSVTDNQRSRQRVNSLNGERFERSGQTGLVRFFAQPVRRDAIDQGTCSMESLFLECMDDPADAVFAKRCHRTLCRRAPR